MSRIIVHEALLRHLQANFPNKLPLKEGITLEEINRLQGEQRVIQFLQAMNDSQSAEEELLDVL